MLFDSDNCCTNAPQCYLMRILSVLLIFPSMPRHTCKICFLYELLWYFWSSTRLQYVSLLTLYGSLLICCMPMFFLLTTFHLCQARSSTAIRLGNWVYCDFITLNTELKSTTLVNNFNIISCYVWASYPRHMNGWNRTIGNVGGLRQMGE